MIALGINGGFRASYQDSSATLIRDGQIVCAVEEERFNRIKYAPGQIPEKSIEWILEKENISLKDVDRLGTHGVTFGPEFENRLKEYFKFRFKYIPPILRVHHHLAHSASSYYASGFDSAVILTVDNSGDGISTQVAVGEKGKIKVLRQYKRPQSLGLFYSMITQFCGFQRDSEEYKLMGLSAYGQPSYDLDFLLSVGGGAYRLNEDYIAPIKEKKPQPHKQSPLFNDKLIKALQLEPRGIREPLTKEYKNLANSAQFQLEKALKEMVTQFCRETKINKLCLAGGVALNCLANQKLAELDFIEDVYVQPASSDAGISLGSAYLASLDLGDKPSPMKSVYLGPSWTEERIFKELKACSVSFKELKDLSLIAQRILKGDIVAWFQGGMEFGPRALGARSILADPFNKNMKERLNSTVKFRENFRPFGPSLLQEDKKDILKSPLKELPYMTITADVRENFRGRLPAISHEDGTSRPQTVCKKQNPLYYKLLQELKRERGRGILLNTSFNKNYEPIVNSPKEALASFFSCGLDLLVIGNFIVEKDL